MLKNLIAKNIQANILSFHSGRRYFISTTVNSKKINLGNVMAWSGHKSINVVNRYIKKGMEQQEEMKELFI